MSFVIESGQPKTEHLELKIKSMMRDDLLFPERAPISSVTLAKKGDFAPLQAADFLSHVYSTDDIYWTHELGKEGLIDYAIMNPKALEKASDELKNIFRRNRRIKNITKKKN